MLVLVVHLLLLVNKTVVRHSDFFSQYNKGTIYKNEKLAIGFFLSRNPVYCKKKNNKNNNDII